MRDLVHLAGRARDRRTRVGVQGERITPRDDRAASRPVLLAVDEDAGARGRIERELRKRYGEDYRVVCEGSAEAAKYASRVTLVARGETLSTSMSDYLIKEIEAAENIEVRLDTSVIGGGGKGRLERLVLEDSTGATTETVSAAALFVLIGAEPHTSWLPEEIKRDENGYVVTGRDLARYGLPRRGWHLGRLPLLMETSMPGVFAAGDVRYGSVKRVASAVGAGAIAIQSVHEYLSSVPQRAGAPTGEVAPVRPRG